MGLIIALLEELTIDLPGNPTVLFAHHVNKAAAQTQQAEKAEKNQPDQTASRGSSALPDGSRLLLNLFKKNDDVVILKMGKSNFTKAMGLINIFKEDDGYLTTKESEPTSKPAPLFG